MPPDLRKLADELAACLRFRNCRVVFAESCTGGLVSAALAQISGISEFHCGSAVVYRLDTKTRWLEVPADVLIDPGPVSEIVARLMSIGVLTKTPEADWSAAITGHLGPQAPADEDGLVFIGISQRDAALVGAVHTTVFEHRLGEPIPSGMTADDPLRERRQVLAAECVLQTLREQIEKPVRSASKGQK